MSKIPQEKPRVIAPVPREEIVVGRVVEMYYCDGNGHRATLSGPIVGFRNKNVALFMPTNYYKKREKPFPIGVGAIEKGWDPEADAAEFRARCPKEQFDATR
jgi:hypothetical protein